MVGWLVGWLMHHDDDDDVFLLAVPCVWNQINPCSNTRRSEYPQHQHQQQHQQPHTTIIITIIQLRIENISHSEQMLIIHKKKRMVTTYLYNVMSFT